GEQGPPEASAFLEQSLEAPAHEHATEDLGGELQPAQQLVGPGVLAQHSKAEDAERRSAQGERHQDLGARAQRVHAGAVYLRLRWQLRETREPDEMALPQPLED